MNDLENLKHTGPLLSITIKCDCKCQYQKSMKTSSGIYQTPIKHCVEMALPVDKFHLSISAMGTCNAQLLLYTCKHISPFTTFYFNAQIFLRYSNSNHESIRNKQKHDKRPKTGKWTTKTYIPFLENVTCFYFCNQDLLLLLFSYILFKMFWVF